MIIAGHTFEPFDSKCKHCGKLITDLMSVTEADVGKLDIAHSGSLTIGEYQSIEDYRNRLITKS